MSKINPNDPARPFWPVAEHRQPDPGLSIRAELAARFMAAQISDKDYVNAMLSSANVDSAPWKECMEAMANRALWAADILIQKLNKTDQDGV